MRFLHTRGAPVLFTNIFYGFRPPLGVSLTFSSLVNLLVATDAETLQVTLFMSTAFCQGLDVMHHFGLGKPAMTLATFAQRVAGNVAVPNPAPSLIVTLVVVVATGEVLVVPLHHLPMVLAVATLVVGQLWATAVSAWSLRFHGHRIHLDFGHKKTSAGIAPLGGQSIFYFR